MLTKVDLFFYLAAFITIVLALALSDMIQCAHRLIRGRERIRWHPLPILAAIFVLLSVLSEFFTLWRDSAITSVSFYGLVWMMVCPSLIALAALAALPDDVPAEGLDLYAFHFENRRYLFGVIFVAFTCDVFRTLGIPSNWSSEELLFYAAMYGPLLGAAVAMAISSRAWVHWAGLAVFFLISHYGYSHWEIHVPAA